ncbi:MAG: TolC family protein [Planctomycetes bacterium]|nr:TolC family protein [Planctomycetota bacterium]
MPITLSAALRLAGTSNLDIAQSREVVRRARIQLQRARILLLPNVNFGSTYVDHDGQIQRAQGDVFTADRNSLFVGLGPSASVHLGDAVFAPLVARQLERASEAGLQRVHNDTLLAIAEAYFTLMRGQRRLARAELTLDMLTSEKPSAIRAGSKGLLPLITAMQKAGAAEAFKSEVYRVEVDVLRRREERATALQEYQVASAELARLLRLSPDMSLWPVEDFRAPLDISGPWTDQSFEAMVRIALSNRPELAENQAQVQAAVERVRAARYRPLIPNLIVNYTFGGFGGGPSPNPIAVIRDGKSIVGGPASVIGNFGSRADFDVGLMWRLQNLGLGNRAEIREQQSLERQANLRQLQLQDTVVAQVVQTREQIKASKDRVNQIRSALYDASGKPVGPLFESTRLNFERIRQVEKTRPLEVLDSLRRLADLLELHAQAATDYERARFRLLVVLGLPAEEIISRAAVPVPGLVPKAK